jgi:flavin-binding protein dodecin
MGHPLEFLRSNKTATTSNFLPRKSIDGVTAVDLSLVVRASILIARVHFLANERINPMAKKQSESVYRIIDVVGVSEKSWEDAGRMAVETAAHSLRDLRIAEVTKMDMKVDNGKVTAFRTRVALSFKYEG